MEAIIDDIQMGAVEDHEEEQGQDNEYAEADFEDEAEKELSK